MKNDGLSEFKALKKSESNNTPSVFGDKDLIKS